MLVPDHVPELDCPAPWHAGHAYTVGYMKALVASVTLGSPARVPQQQALGGSTP